MDVICLQSIVAEFGSTYSKFVKLVMVADTVPVSWLSDNETNVRPDNALIHTGTLPDSAFPCSDSACSPAAVARTVGMEPLKLFWARFRDLHMP